MMQDAVDRIRATTGRARDDGSTVAVLSRFYRLMAHVDRAVNELYDRHGLTHGEANVLGALAAATGEDALTPTRLSSLLMCSSGAMTNRLDRLEADGLIERSRDPDDRRGTRIGITKAGRQRIRAASAEREKIEAALVPGISAAERRTLVGLLRKMLVAYEDAHID
jgi:DNA-binding MarR family transcriptional regulator